MLVLINTDPQRGMERQDVNLVQFSQHPQNRLEACNRRFCTPDDHHGLMTQEIPPDLPTADLTASNMVVSYMHHSDPTCRTGFTRARGITLKRATTSTCDPIAAEAQNPMDELCTLLRHPSIV